MPVATIHDPVKPERIEKVVIPPVPLIHRDVLIATHRSLEVSSLDELRAAIDPTTIEGKVVRLGVLLRRHLANVKTSAAIEILEAFDAIDSEVNEDLDMSKASELTFDEKGLPVSKPGFATKALAIKKKV